MDDRPPEDESIGALLARLVEDARAFVRAEVALYRSQIATRLGQVKTIAILGLAALVIANAALIALLVGLILAISASLGPGWATMIVVGVSLVIAALLGWLAAGHVRKVTAPRADTEGGE